MKITQASLETVCGLTSDLPKNTLPEVAFCGRSNVGKSSLINAVLNRKALARTSAEPGKTQTLNFYRIDDAIYLVDLPGYGYAKASKSVTEKWGKMIQRYFAESEMLQYIFLLVDMRHAPTKLDVAMMDTIRYLDYQPVVIATKADKLKKNERAKNLKVIRSTLSLSADDIVIPFSSVTKEGREEVVDLMAQVAENFLFTGQDFFRQFGSVNALFLPVFDDGHVYDPLFHEVQGGGNLSEGDDIELHAGRQLEEGLAAPVNTAGGEDEALDAGEFRQQFLDVLVAAVVVVRDGSR